MWTSDVSRPSPSADGAGGHSYGAASDGTNIVIALPAVVAIDEATGAQRWTLSTDLGDAAIGDVSNGVLIMGGQDDDTTALAIDSGNVLWTRPGSPPYDNVWAVADGAVYVRDDNDLVAYQLHDGTERWRVALDPTTYTWPWLAADQSLYTMWWNLEARTTSDGSVRWTTDHPTGTAPTDDTPRMIGATKAGSSILVAYTSGVGPGD